MKLHSIPLGAPILLARMCHVSLHPLRSTHSPTIKMSLLPKTIKPSEDWQLDLLRNHFSSSINFSLCWRNRWYCQKGRNNPSIDAQATKTFGDPKSNSINIGCPCLVRGEGHWKSQALVNSCNCHEGYFIVHIKFDGLVAWLDKGSNET